jgi:hypothetical protein
MNRTGLPIYVRTHIGIFKVTISPSNTIDPITRENKIINYMLNIGGKNNCVQIKIPNDVTNTIGELLSVKTSHGECEMNGLSIRGEKTIHMILLAITLLRSEFPHTQLLHLQDMSSFVCQFENSSKQGISLSLYEILFHKEAWYERRFGAKLLDKDLYDSYTKAIEGAESVRKPDLFDFRNNVLQSKLGPLYSESKTWGEFLDKIYKHENVCEIIAPWYKYALFNILGPISYEGQWWKIEFEKNTKIKQISYTVVRRGGTRKLKRIYRDKKEDEIIMNNEPLSYDELYKLI